VGHSNEEKSFTAGPARVDVETGVMRLGGNRELYFRLLRLLATKYGSVVQDIDGALERGDTEQANRLLHTVKGVAANLGADTLSDTAAAWEAAVNQRTSAEALKTCRVKFVSALHESVKKILAFAVDS
jgi:HPt (histidine-containing phosphotransfer) domain-containing protein